MKRLVYLVLLIGIPLIAWFQYVKYKKFHPPTDYTYPIHDSIDVHYHDPAVVQLYFEKAVACKTFARYCWRKHRIDVLTPDIDNPNSKELVDQYHALVATAQHLERKLLASTYMKAQGYSNQQIAQWEQSGLSQQSWQIREILGPSGVILYGEDGPGIWKIQRRLNDLGYDIRIDGIFDQETLDALNQYQISKEMKPTLGIDQRILIQMFASDSLFEAYD